MHVYFRERPITSVSAVVFRVGKEKILMLPSDICDCIHPPQLDPRCLLCVRVSLSPHIKLHAHASFRGIASFIFATFTLAALFLAVAASSIVILACCKLSFTFNVSPCLIPVAQSLFCYAF